METLDDYDYELPAELIAQAPSQVRSASRLLVMPRARDAAGLGDHAFSDLPELLRAGDLLVVNDTRVIRARLFGRKPGGGRVELLLERIQSDTEALVQARSNRPLRDGTVIGLTPAASAERTSRFEVEIIARQHSFYMVRARTAWAELLEQCGHLPLPPYIDRAPERRDEDRYQTVYAERPGAVAAPTAGLHFDAALLERLSGAGIAHMPLTLHVGAGTFQPVRGDLDSHRMHAERYAIDAELCARIESTRAGGGRIVAVGTTVVRALESAAQAWPAPGAPRPTAGDTELFIRPGFQFQVVDALITNFHLPRTTLMLLVSAFASRERVLDAYRHAVKARYRFFSYGDAMLIQ
ncbi:MAG: tRNA preQ1(34) S-adenosylmethionine ribosyltransferase-isomerase QueA [Pseudomonadota bacterium]